MLFASLLINRTASLLPKAIFVPKANMTKRSIPEFFSSFPDFTPDPTAALTDEFSRLSLTRGWKTGSKNYKEQHNRFLLAEFDAHLGDIERGNKLERWQALCIELGAKEKFPSITKCKNVSWKGAGTRGLEIEHG